MRLERLVLESFEDEDACGRCGAEIIFRPPLPRYYWIRDGRKLCDDCGQTEQAIQDVLAVEVD